MKVLANLDLNKNELQNAKIHNLATAPSTPSVGQIYYNTADNKFYGWNGTTWVDFGQVLTGDSIISLLNASASLIDDNNLSTNVNDAITKKHTQNTDTTLTGSGINTINTTGAGNIVDFKVNGVVKTSIDTNGNFSGKSATADKWTTTRTIAMTGDAVASATNIDGSANVSLAVTLKSVGTAGVQSPKVTTDAQGRVISSSALVATDIPSLTHDKISDFDAGVQVNRLDQLAVPTTSLNVNNQKIINVATPTLGTDAVNKDYVDLARAGLSVKDPVRVASTANVVIATGGLLTIDGITLVAGNRVLLKNQTTGSENGIYVVASGAWTRATDANTSAEVVGGLAVWVNEGTANGDSRWVLTTNDTITLGTTALVFTKDFQASDVVAGSGMTKTGNQLDVVGTANRITANADSIDIASTYVGQTSITTLGTVGTGTWQGTDVAIAYGGTGSSTAVGARTNLGATGKYSTTIGDGVATQFTITHSLNTTDYTILIRENNSPYEIVMVDNQMIDVNSLKIIFTVAPTANQYKVVVTG